VPVSSSSRSAVGAERMYACTWVLQGINPLLAAYVCCLVDVKRVQQHFNRRGTAQARHLHVTVSQGLGGPTAQVAFMAPHFGIIRSSQ
jgi:hypothetical protein